MNENCNIRAKNKAGNREIKVITLQGAVVNILLALLKIIFGLLGGSIALVADGLHSFSDLITDLMVLIGVKLSNIPPDEDHPYGHGKIETIFTILIGLVLCVVGGGILREAVLRLIAKEHFTPGYSIIVLALISILAKEILFYKTKKIAKKFNRSSLLANAWHHRSDSLSSVAVLAGGLSAQFGFYHGDQIAGIIVGAMVFIAGAKIIMDPVGELCEHSIDKASIEKIKNILDSEIEICGWNHLRTRQVGRIIFIDLSLFVEPEMTVEVSHALVDLIEEKIRNAFNVPINIIIHIEPYFSDVG